MKIFKQLLKLTLFEIKSISGTQKIYRYPWIKAVCSYPRFYKNWFILIAILTKKLFKKLSIFFTILIVIWHQNGKRACVNFIFMKWSVFLVFFKAVSSLLRIFSLDTIWRLLFFFNCTLVIIVSNAFLSIRVLFIQNDKNCYRPT